MNDEREQLRQLDKEQLIDIILELRETVKRLACHGADARGVPNLGDILPTPKGGGFCGERRMPCVMQGLPPTETV